MSMNFAKTKIICTIGPATQSIEKLIELMKAGMDVARLNFSHGCHDDHLQTILNVREASKIYGRQIPILMDLCGPKLRIGEVKEEFQVEKGEEIIITTDNIIGDKNKLSTVYQNLPKDVKPGDIILIDDGLIKLVVSKTEGNNVHCKILNNGIIKSKKGMNLPGVAVSAPSITEKDKEDVLFGLKNKVDFFALSFVRSWSDIKELREFIQQNNGGVNKMIVAKIEKPEAIADIDDIIQETDMVMVARGDLGVEMNTEDVPILQKMIIEKCNYYNKPVITATQMLESMIHNARPTRAEASDVANAVFDGTDAVMLSAETSVGEYPIQTVKIMDKIARRAEQKNWAMRTQFAPTPNEDMKLAGDLSSAACSIARDIKAAAIIAITKSGRTAKLLSRYRVGTPILAFTEDEEVIKTLNIVWGVQGEMIDNLADTDTTLARSKELAIERGYIKKGDVVVFVAGIPLFISNVVNMIKVEKI
jgi:pyruvate kinase